MTCLGFLLLFVFKTLRHKIGSFASSDPYTQFPVVRPARRPKTISSKLFRPTYPQCISLLPIVKICWLVSMKIYQEIFHPIQKFHWSSHFHQVEISPATSTSILDSKIFCQLCKAHGKSKEVEEHGKLTILALK